MSAASNVIFSRIWLRWRTPGGCADTPRVRRSVQGRSVFIRVSVWRREKSYISAEAYEASWWHCVLALSR